MSANISLALALSCFFMFSFVMVVIVAGAMYLRIVRPWMLHREMQKYANDQATFNALLRAHPEWLPAAGMVKEFDVDAVFALSAATSMRRVVDGLEFMFDGHTYYLDPGDMHLEMVHKGKRLGELPRGYARQIARDMTTMAEQRTQKAISGGKQHNNNHQGKHNNNNQGGKGKWGALVGQSLDYNPGQPPNGLVVNTFDDPHTGVRTWVVEKA
jgi:hypothetical protein